MQVNRLFQTLQPKHYQLSLDINRVDRSFHGHVVITGDKVSNQPIGLHTKGLEITSSTVNDQPAKLTTKDNGEVYLETDIDTGEVTIELDFNGKITDAMHGLYPCYYQDSDNKKELLATQFESHHAREVFPCIDEPEAKATFDLSLVTENNVSVLANMPVDSQNVVDGDKLETSFQTSPKMSPYLLAFVVGELQSKSTKTKDGVVVTSWATKAQPASSLDFSLEVARKSIEFFNDYFGVAYPLPKADHVALPDFSSGAMENWGLITYREVCLLVDKDSAISARQYVATVIAHETSHQWFGNLVTMKWWDDLWLNESFATLMEYVCVDALYPQWQMWLTFATQEVLSALRRDYLPGIQAIKTTVNHPDEISTLFDPSIVYAKGARTLAMCRQFVGEASFREGLKNYFEKHQYGNTTGDDLWQAFSEASQKEVTDFMTPWIEQPGMPEVSVKLNDKDVSISQQRFTIPAQRSVEDTVWPIPLNGEPAQLNTTLMASSASIELDNADSLVQLNRGATTHAIVRYDENLLQRLRQAVNQGQLEPVDRLNLLHDYSLLARAGHATASELWNLLLNYSTEDSEPVWDIISLVIADLKRLIEADDPAEDSLKSKITDLALSRYEQLGWSEKTGETESDTKLRATIIGLLAYAEYQEVIQKALSDFDKAKHLSDLDGELRSIIFSVVSKHGNEEQIERLITVHNSTSNSELKNDLAAGLTSTRNPELIERLIGQLKDESIVRKQDIFRWFVYLIRSRYAREQMWQWLETNWGWLEESFGGDKSYDDFARLSAAGLSTHEWLDRYRNFWDDKKQIPALTRAIELGEKDIQVRADWVERDSKIFSKLLTDQVKN